MSFRFNFTGRMNLRHKDFRLEVAEFASPLTINLSLPVGLADRFPSHKNARLIIEAYRQSEAQRLDVGLLSDYKQNRPLVLDRFENGDHVLYRIKIVDPLSKRILGMATKIRPVGGKEKPKDRESLLPVQFATDKDRMGGQIWKLRFDIDHPTVLLDKARVAGFDFVKEPRFRLLALPQVLKEILLYAFVVKAGSLLSWKDDWKNFVEVGLGVDGCPADDDINDDNRGEYMDHVIDWIDRAVEQLSRAEKLGNLKI